MHVALDTSSTLEETTGTKCVEDMRFVVRVTVPYDSPDDPCVFCHISERTGRRRCDLCRKTGNNGWPARSNNSRHRKTGDHGVFTCFAKVRGEKTRLAGARMRAPVRLLSQHRQKVPTVPEAKHSEKPNWSSTNPHVSGSFPAVFPCPTTDVGQDEGQPIVPYLMIGRQATSSMLCASPQHTLWSSHSSGQSRLDRSGALGPATTIGVFTTPLADSSLRRLKGENRSL